MKIHNHQNLSKKQKQNIILHKLLSTSKIFFFIFIISCLFISQTNALFGGEKKATVKVTKKATVKVNVLDIKVDVVLQLVVHAVKHLLNVLNKQKFVEEKINYVV